MIYKTISLGNIIRKIMRDLKPGGDNWISDAVEWAGEALEAIGSGPNYEPHTELLKVVNYTAHMPSNLMEINALKVNAQDVTSKVLSSYTIPLYYDGSVFPRGIHCDNCVNEYANVGEHRYVIRGNAIKVSYQTGYVCMSYKRFAVDENNWPLLPDDFSFKQAIYWYVFMKMMEGGMTHQHISYPKAEERWLHYAGQSADMSKMPDIAQMENFMNQWVRLIPNMSQFESGFSNLQSSEELDRDYIAESAWGPNDPIADIIQDTTNL
jgi:hypothetical protein